jgi:cytochrome c-type biogenesis protein CcmH
MPRARILAVIAALLAAIACAMPALAVQPDEILSDPALESRARHLSRELRCMVCQNQSIDDSDAPLARDLRLLVRDRLKAGDSDAQVMDFLTARYGDFVLLNPPFNWRTALLWFAPAGVLIAGALGLLMFLRRRAGHGEEMIPDSAAPLSVTEQAKIAEILSEPEK